MVNKIYTVSEHLNYSGVVEIQSNISDKGLPTFELSGLVSKSVEESKKRVVISLENSGFNFPLKNILINIAPASISKSGTHYDLGIAISIIKEKITIPFEKSAFIGELSFDGSIRKVENIFYLVVTAIEKGFKHIYVPEESSNQFFKIGDVNIYPLKNLSDLLKLSDISPINFNLDPLKEIKNESNVYSRIKANHFGKKAISYSLIGNHSIFLQGFPGVGKSMLVKSMLELAPNLEFEDYLNVSKIYSYAGLTLDSNQFTLPFRNPHPLSSYSSMFGSFSSKLIVGEVCLANKGILFLDEFPEFNRLIIEGLRLPLEDKIINLSRSGIKTKLDCDFILAATSNFCKCGYFNHPKIGCNCSPIDIRRYQSRISGPILDRIDIKVIIPEMGTNKIEEGNKYSYLDFTNIKKTIHEKKKIRKSLLNIDKSTKYNESSLCNIIVQRFLPLNLYNILINELKSNSISERAKNKLINLIFTISIFNNREIISIEDLFEGISMSIKKHSL